MGEAAFRVQYNVNFSVITCCSCRFDFAVRIDALERWKEKGFTFVCPSCRNTQWFGESESDRLRRKLERAEKSLESANEQKLFLERQIAAEKGAKTKLKKRLSNGVCPSCNRSFANLKKHMECKHPDFAKTA